MVEEPPIDPNEERYCRCKGVSYGEMVACDNTDCPIEWFHFGCVGLTVMVRVAGVVIAPIFDSLALLSPASIPRVTPPVVPPSQPKGKWYCSEECRLECEEGKKPRTR